jgi:hypothetical protein
MRWLTAEVGRVACLSLLDFVGKYGKKKKRRGVWDELVCVGWVVLKDSSCACVGARALFVLVDVCGKL